VFESAVMLVKLFWSPSQVQ